MNQSGSVMAGQRRRSAWLPLLVFLFVVSYGLLTMLVVLQDRTIDAQSDLIHLLFKETGRLNPMTAQKTVISKPAGWQASARRHLPSSHKAEAPAVDGTVDRSKIEAPSTQVPLSQNAAQIPSSQEKRQATAKPGRKQHKAGKANPSQPPAEMTDPSDMRRTLLSI